MIQQHDPSPAGETARRRPPLFRALGRNDPPGEVQVAGRNWRLERVIKHDSWAATATYTAAETDQPPPSRIVCKFNRIQPLLFVPCRWLGRWLASREARMHDRLAGIAGIAAGYRRVENDGRVLPHAVAHDYLEGHPLRWHDLVTPAFFEALHQLVLEVHSRGVALVDLNKWENILIDPNGRPALIDFQISAALSPRGLSGVLLRVLQQCDLYHLSKHAGRVCPGQFGEGHFGPQPWWIRLHRGVAGPFRALRRRVLVGLGIRRGAGKPQSEEFIEEGLRGVSGGNAPVERLYRLLASDEYRRRSPEGGTTFFGQMFLDLVGRPPVNELEREFVERMTSRTLHDQIVWLLKSELFLVRTGQWQPVHVNRIHDQLSRQLAGAPPVAEPSEGAQPVRRCA